MDEQAGMDRKEDGVSCFHGQDRYSYSFLSSFVFSF